METAQIGLYAGWNTYQTWVTNLWLMNDEYLYKRVEEFVKRSKSKNELAYELIELLRDITDYDNQNIVTQNIIDSFIDNVDWSELAEAYLNDLR